MRVVKNDSPLKDGDYLIKIPLSDEERELFLKDQIKYLKENNKNLKKQIEKLEKKKSYSNFYIERFKSICKLIPGIFNSFFKKK